MVYKLYLTRRVVPVLIHKRFNIRPLAINPNRAGAWEREWEQRLTCTNCLAVFSSSAKLWRHHENAREETFTCDTCGKFCCSARHLELHQRECVEEDITYQCASCGYVATSQNAMRRHHQQAVKMELKCDECEYEFCTFSKYERHMKENHYNDERRTKPFICADCGQGFVEYWNLEIHRRKAKNENITCEKCNIKLCNKFQKKQHDKKHHSSSTDPTLWECPECSLVFRERRSAALKWIVRRHIWQQHPTMCTACHKVFGNLNELKEHQLYTCPLRGTAGSELETAVGRTKAMSDLLLQTERPRQNAVISNRHEDVKTKLSSEKFGRRIISGLTLLI